MSAQSQTVSGRIAARFVVRLYYCVAALALLWLPSPARSAQGEVTLEWDRNTEPEVTGYRLHIGTAAGVYDRIRDAGNSTLASVNELVAGKTYFFVVTAYDAAGNESPPSNEVSFNVPWPTNLQVAALSPSTGSGAPRCEPVFEKASPSFGMQIDARDWAAVTIFASSDMRSWTPLGTIPNSSGRVLVRDLESLEFPKRFYKVSRAQSLSP